MVIQVNIDRGERKIAIHSFLEREKLRWIVKATRVMQIERANEREREIDRDRE